MRDNLARKITHPTQEIATVVGALGRELRVRSSLGEVVARRAVSCLLEPALGDEVLVVHHERGSHVLAVLERDSEAPARLSTEGDLEISAAAGRVSMSARDGVHLLTPGEAVVAAGSVHMSAKQGEVAIGALTYIGERVTAQIDRAKTVAQSLETVAERCVQRLERAYRFISRSEVVRAEYMELEAQSAFHVKAETTLINSGGLTKLDGSQIHLG